MILFDSLCSGSVQMKLGRT